MCNSDSESSPNSTEAVNGIESILGQPISPPKSQRNLFHKYAVWFILIFSFFTHLICFINSHSNDPFYSTFLPGTDMNTYNSWAIKISKGDWLSKEMTDNKPFYYGPLYPYFLAVLYKILGVNLDIIHIIQGTLGILPSIFIFLAAKNFFGFYAAIFSGILTAICGPFLFYEQHFLQEGLLLIIHSVLIWVLSLIWDFKNTQKKLKRFWLLPLIGGILSGLACIGRGNFISVIPFITLTWFIFPLLKKQNLPFKNCVKYSVIYLLGILFILVFPIVRNVLVSGKAVITGNGPILFYIGNAPDSTGTLADLDSMKNLLKTYGSPEKVPWIAEVKKYFLENPTRFIILFARKTYMFINSYDIPDNVNYYFYKRFSPILRWTPSTWIILVPLGFIGLWTVREDWKKQMPLYLYTFGFAMSIIVVFVVGRYRLMFLLTMIIWSGCAFEGLIKDFWEKRLRTLSIKLIVFSSGVILLLPEFSPAVMKITIESEDNKQEQYKHLIRANDYSLISLALIQSGKTERAIKILEEGVDVCPFYRTIVLRLTSLYFKANLTRKVIPVLKNYLEFKPDDEQALFQLAVAQTDVGEKIQALRTLQQLLTINPEHKKARLLFEELKNNVQRDIQKDSLP